MSTFPYVDISHKKIWRPLSTGRYVDPTLFLFIYLFRGRLPSFLAQLRRFVQTVQVPRGLQRDVAPSRRVWAGGGLRVLLPSLPRSPLFSPRLVTIRRNVVAGSMTPWVEAASPLSSLPVAAGSGRAAQAGARATCRGQGQSAALSPRPAQVPGHPRGEGLWRPRGPRPGCPPQAGPRPQPASASPSPRSSPERQLALCVCPTRG